MKSDSDRLQISTPIYAEALAVLKGLDIRNNTEVRNIAICTDSLAIMKLLQNNYKDDSIIQEI